MQIKAAVVRTKGAPSNIEPVSLRSPVADEVLVRIVATGMYHTEMIIRDQYYPVPLPVVLGHEGAGVVESVAPQVKHLQPGDHVMPTYGSCGHCMPCASGLSSYCKEFYNLNFGGVGTDGTCAIDYEHDHSLHDHFLSQPSFATYSLSRENNAIKAPKNAPTQH